MYLVNTYQLNNEEYHFIEVRQNNIKVTFMDYGATIMSIFVPDYKGKMETVVMAYDSLKGYMNNPLYLNAIVGPLSGRIKDGILPIHNETYQLDKNENNKTNLHGGKIAFSFRKFDYEILDDEKETKVVFTISQKEDNTSYPGNIKVRITYTVKEGYLDIDYSGTTDKATLLNLTNHAYFNLSGNMKDDCVSQILYVNASNYIETDPFQIPVSIQSVENTPLDCKEASPLSTHIRENNNQGIDYAYLLDTVDDTIVQASLYDETSKRFLEVYTDYPCIVCYTHNDPTQTRLLFDQSQTKHQGVCFEAQLEPNSVHLEEVNDNILEANEHYHYHTTYKFSVKE